MLNESLLSESRGGDDEVESNSKQDKEKASPSDESLGSKLVGITRVSPLVRGVDGRVSVDVGTILVLEPVDAISLRLISDVSERRSARSPRFAHLALPSLGINPSLLLHEPGSSLKVLLDGGVLDGLEADLRAITRSVLHVTRGKTFMVR